MKENNNMSNFYNNINDIINIWKKDDESKPSKFRKIYNIYKKDIHGQDIKDEDKIMLTFIEENPFISYKEFNNIAMKNGLIDSSLVIPFDIYNISKLLYMNPIDKNKIIEIGKALYESGGKKLMRLVSKILTYYYNQYSDPVVFSQQAIIDLIWDNIESNWKYS